MAGFDKRIYVRYPIFDTQGQTEERKDNFNSWITDNYEHIMAKYNLADFDCVSLEPRKVLWLSGGVLVVFPAAKDTQVPKGLVVRLELLVLLDQLHSQGINRDGSYLIIAASI
jgi:hypothetical protein